MTSGAIEALQADRQALLDICAGLSDDDWKAPSGCDGWSVQDVVSHVGALFWVVVDPASLPDTAGMPTERAQEVNVEARRTWSSDRVVADYESVSTRGLALLADLEDQDFEVPLGDLGTYPAAVLPNAFSFDHYTHIRADLFGPRGPLPGEPPPSDELRLAPAIDWIAAALPQQNGEALRPCRGGIEIALTGPGARTIRLGEGPTAARIGSDTPSFVRWVTQRATWEEAGVDAAGDDEELAIARSLHVF